MKLKLVLTASLALATAAHAQDANKQVDQLVEAYYEETLPLNPTQATSTGDHRFNHLYVPSFAESRLMKLDDITRKYAGQLAAVKRADLDADHQITYDVFRHTLDNWQRSRRFPGHLQPLNQFFNFTAGFAQLGSGTGQHPFRTVKDYDDFLSRMRGFDQAVDTAIANMRRGIAAGIVQPRILMERALPQLSAHVVTVVDSSTFYRPVVNMPTTFSAAERERLTAAYRHAIMNVVVPAYKRLHDFVRDEYVPRARDTFGMNSLPSGSAWYAQQAHNATTTDLTPSQIHDIGLAEVARIHKEMDRVKEQVGFTGTLQEFFRHLQTDPRYNFTSREEMLQDYRAAQARIDGLTDRLFNVKPKASYEIRPVEAFRERSAAIGSYQAASPDGSRPGVFYLNTYDPTSRARYQMESLLLHEGSPGHHFQIMIQRELEGLPRVRRFGGYSAFSEGWGLYAESLGKDLGVYTDPYQYYGALNGELWRAIRLVLDTGIHDKGWTREQAIEYARRNSSQSETNIVSEVERFSAIPGQALSYKIGQLKISELRQRAEKALGAHFNIKTFHRKVLESGAIPLSVLEAKIDRWIEEGTRTQGLTYWNETRNIPEPLSVHVLKVDLHDQAIQVDVVIADDPDGPGPAEATLTNPIELARRANVIAAVNANAFAGIPDSTGKPDNRWREGLPVNIAGIAVHDGVVRSKGADSSTVNVVFGVDKNGRAYIGPARSNTTLEEAVNAWSFRMVRNGKAIPRGEGVRHPRTTVGIDSTGRWLYIVVVDGRQENYSVGMTPRELSDLMIQLGAHTAVNLDGGGSSIMLMAKGDSLHVMNRPSGGQPRPVPVLLTIRRR